MIKNIVSFVVLCLVVSCINSDKRQEAKPLTKQEQEQYNKILKAVDSYSLEHITNKANESKSKKNALVLDTKKQIKRKNQNVKPYLKQ